VNGDFGLKPLLVAAFAWSLVSQGCTLLLDYQKQCGTDDDCKKFSSSALCVNATCQEDTTQPSASDAGSDPTWGCLGKVMPATSSATQVAIQLPLFDIVTRKPVTSVRVRACPKMDMNCANPLGPQISPDSTGVATLTVRAAFDGYVEIKDSSADPATAILPSLFFVNPAPLADTRYGIIPLFSGGTIAQLAAAQGNTVDPALGHIFSAALDCQSLPAAGVSWEPDRLGDATRRFYYVEGLPSEAASMTDVTGYGGLINVPTGTIRLNAKRQMTGQALGTTTLFVRASQLSLGFIVPAP
jgi:hypothetical protein